AAGAAGTCPASSAHGRPRLPAHRSASRPGLQAVRALEARSDAPGGDLLDPDGAAAEALDPGDAERGYVRGFPLFLRHLRVEQPPALQCRGRALGDSALTDVRARGTSGGARPARPTDGRTENRCP